MCNLGDLSHVVLEIDTGIFGGFRDKEYYGDIMLGRRGPKAAQRKT